MLCGGECGDMPRQPIAFWISAQVAGITCMMPRAPTGEIAAGSSALSCTPCALAQRQSGPADSPRDAARWNSESKRDSESTRGEDESDQQGGADVALAVIISSSARIAEDERQRPALPLEMFPPAGEH